jgi:DNA-binding transcriptional LysR family regulator
MDRLEAMSVFVAAVDSGSLAGAARKLGSSPASVTRAIVQLELASGERLLERSTRQLSVTEAGLRHLASYKLMLNELSSLEQNSSDVEISGSVVITAPELFGRLHVMPAVESFLKLYPRTQMRVLLLNRMVDLVGEGVDLALRLANLPDSSMKAIKLGEVRKMVCAAPVYLKEYPAPEHPVDITSHACIGLNAEGMQELWQYRDPGSMRVRSIRVACRLTLNSAEGAIDAAIRGLGLVRPMSYQVKKHIAQRSLCALLPDYELQPIPVHMVFQSSKRTTSVLQAFIDHAKPLLREALAESS